MIRGLLNLIIDGQFGSTGKGKLAAFLARKYDVDIAVCNNASNAGHTFYLDDKKYVAFHLPAAAANKRTELYIGPTAMITVPMLFEELEAFADLDVERRLHIHPLAVIITPECREWEKENLVRISSTTKGCGRALAMKVMRHPDTMLAGDEPRLREWIMKEDMRQELYDAMEQGKTVLAESAQGFGLSLNHGIMYPYCTSRDVTTAQVLNDCGVPVSKLGDVYASLRCHPIRVGNVLDGEGKMLGFSGPVFDDQEELTWEDITKSSGSNKPLLERTTVTNKVRRVFSWSNKQMQQFVQLCEPTYLFVNFINYLDDAANGENNASNIIKYPNIMRFVQMLHNSVDAPIAYLGTGPREGDIVDFGVDALEEAHG